DGAPSRCGVPGGRRDPPRADAHPPDGSKHGRPAPVPQHGDRGAVPEPVPADPPPGPRRERGAGLGVRQRALLVRAAAHGVPGARLRLRRLRAAPPPGERVRLHARRAGRARAPSLSGQPLRGRFLGGGAGARARVWRRRGGEPARDPPPAAARRPLRVLPLPQPAQPGGKGERGHGPRHAPVPLHRRGRAPPLPGKRAGAGQGAAVRGAPAQRVRPAPRAPELVGLAGARLRRRGRGARRRSLAALPELHVPGAEPRL
ncbi:MAG: hypothetical protein AVDCRST_MAG68-5634, partial [uncultured Gemmatimonadetes bacterium]